MSSIDVTTVPEAIMRMGAGAVRNLAVTLCVTSIMGPQRYGAHGQLLVDHGLGTAYVARRVADDAGADPDQAFLCGLLHDIGRMVILKWHYDHVKRTGQAMDATELAEMLTRWHPQVASLAFRRWGLPSELDEPVLHHHDYTQATTARRMAAVIYLANRLSHRHGFGRAGRDGSLSDPVTSESSSTQRPAEIDQRAPGLFSGARRAS
jgi:putative nucleotidyltransferase with HDIG domain